MFVLLIPALVGALSAAMATFIGRAIIAMGVGFVSYKGIDTGIGLLKTAAMDGMRGMPADALQLVAYLWMDKALSVVFSAVAISLTMRALGGTLKKMVLK